MKKYLSFFSFLVLFSVAFSLTSKPALATAGPVGLNQLMTEAGPGAGQITLHWSRYAPNVDNYSIFYGTAPGQYQYAAASIGNDVVYTVGYLQPGVRYYFLIQGYAQGQVLPQVTPEISDVAMSASTTVVGTAGPFGQRQLSAVRGPGTGQVTLKWLSLLQNTTNFSLIYGIQPGTYIYGALNIAPNATPGSWQTYTVNALNPGQRYYFAVVPMQGGEGILSSAEVSQVAP